jgi:hypothetical protein
MDLMDYWQYADNVQGFIFLRFWRYQFTQQVTEILRAVL